MKRYILIILMLFPLVGYSQVINLDTNGDGLNEIFQKKASKKKDLPWVMKSNHKWLREVVEDWATQAGYELFWETRDFELKIRADKQLSAGTFFDALTLLGEAYRNSDAPFQIQPTAYKQIIVRPMSGKDQGE
jgi:hypothetical protein